MSFEEIRGEWFAAVKEANVEQMKALLDQEPALLNEKADNKESALTILLQEYKEQRKNKDSGSDNKFDAVQHALAALLAREPKVSKDDLTKHAGLELLPMLYKLYDSINGDMYGTFPEVMINLICAEAVACDLNLAPIVLANAFPEAFGAYGQDIWGGALGAQASHLIDTAHSTHQNLFSLFGPHNILVRGFLETYVDAAQDSQEGDGKHAAAFCVANGRIVDSVQESSGEIKSRIEAICEDTRIFERIVAQYSGSISEELCKPASGARGLFGGGKVEHYPEESAAGGCLWFFADEDYSLVGGSESGGAAAASSSRSDVAGVLGELAPQGTPSLYYSDYIHKRWNGRELEPIALWEPWEMGARILIYDPQKVKWTP